ncbi:unnamed protein product, partial [Prorocentrum cordatum]
ERNTKIVYHNVQWADYTRLEEISMQTANIDVYAAIGTGRAARDDDYTKCQLPNHQCIQFGWRKAASVNNSCGLAVLLNKRLSGRVQRVVAPPTTSGITGRIGMITVTVGTIDLALFPTYIPPRGMAVNTHKGITRNILKWTQSELDKLGHNCLPIILGDYNCAFGMRRDTTGRKYIEATESIGIEEPALENITSSQMRDFLDDDHLAITDTFRRTGPTYYGGARTSKIDHVALPATALCRVRQTNPLLGLARRLQLHVSAHLADHVPMCMNLDVRIAKTHISKLAPHANRDLMMIVYTRGYKRLEISKKVEETTQQIDETEWRQAWGQGNVQKWWDMVSNNILEAMQETFPKHEQDITGYDEMRQQRMHLLEKRSQLRAATHHSGIKSYRGDGYTEFDEIEEQLKALSRKLQVLRRRQKTEKTEKLVGQIGAAWKHHRHAELHRLRVALANAGRGPKKRNLCAPRTGMPVSQWDHGLSRPPQLGGTHCEKIDWQEWIADRTFMPHIRENRFARIGQ